MELTKEQKRAIALATARKRLQSQMADAQQPSADKEIAPPTAEQQLMYMPDEFTGEATAEAKEFLPGFGTAALQGLTFGLSDEIGAGVEGLKALARGEEFMPAAKQRMAESSAERAAFREQYPKSAIAGEILGSLPLGVAGAAKLAARQAAKGTGRLASIGQQALMAGAGGAVAGFGGAEGDIEQRAKSAAISGLIGGGLGAAGAALPTGATREVRGLLDEGIPLTVGQQLGGPVAYAENLLGKTLVGDIAGISSAQRKAFEGFSKNFIQDALEPIGVKIPKGMDVNKAAKFAEDKIKSTFTEAVKKADLPDTTPVLDMLESAIKPKSLNDIDLNLDDIKQVRKILQDSVASNIFENKMTGQMVQKSLKALNNATKKADLGDNAKQVIKAAKENLESILVSQNRDNVALMNARKAYRNMFPMKAAAKKGRARGAFTPEQATAALESAKYMDAPMYEGVKRAEDILTGSVPAKEGTAGLLTLPKLATGGGLYAAGTQALPALAGLASIYRTGPLGAAVAREALSTPGYLARSLAAAPAVSGMTGSLLAEQE
jgi:hypothetical protein